MVGPRRCSPTQRVSGPRPERERWAVLVCRLVHTFGGMGAVDAAWPDQFEDLVAAIHAAPPGTYMPDDETVAPEVIRSLLVTDDGARTAYTWRIDVERVKLLGRALVNSNVRTPMIDDAAAADAP